MLVRDVVADYSERSPTSALPPNGDADSVVRDALDRVAGLGPLLTRVAFGFADPQALIALALLSLGGGRPTLPGR